MATFSIPDRDRDALADLLKLTPADAEVLDREIEQSDQTLASITTLLDKRDLDGKLTAHALISLLAASRQYHVETSRLVAGLRQSSDVADGGGGIDLLLRNKTLIRFSKALELRNEYEHILTNTRILSDIRPVFSDDAKNPSVEAVIVNHTLRIAYVDSGSERREVYVALDTSDLEKLKTQIDRALKKNKAAKDLAESANVAVLQPIAEES